MGKTLFMLLCTVCIWPLTDADASTITYTYDASGRLTRATYDDSRVIRYAYDPAGNLLTVAVQETLSLAGDFDASGGVDFADFFLFADAFGGADLVSDLDGSGMVDFADFFLFADSFGQSITGKRIAGRALEMSDLELMLQAEFKERELHVQVGLSHARDARGYGLVLRFDPLALRYREARPVGSAGLLLAREGAPGILFLGQAWPETSAGDSLEVRFDVLRDDATLQVTEGAVRENGQIRPLLLPKVMLPHLPRSFVLQPNYPNPFNSNTMIRFSLPADGDIDLSVYDLAGQKVATLVAGHRERGTYRVNWDGTDERGRELASGMYVCRLQAGKGLVETRKLVLVR